MTTAEEPVATAFGADFAHKLETIMARPGFGKPQGSAIFTEAAMKLLAHGIGEEETLDIMENAYVAGTEHYGSYESGINLAHLLMSFGFEEEEAFELAHKTSMALEWIDPKRTQKVYSPLSQIITISVK